MSPIASKAGLKGVCLIYTLHMIVIVVDGLRNEEIFEGQALEDWV
jgi:hypothetical protein